MLVVLGFLLVCLSLSSKTGEVNIILLSVGTVFLLADRLFDWLEGRK